MKKFFVTGGLTLSVLTLVLLCAACKPKQEAAAAADPNAPVTLTVWCWDPSFNIYSMNEAAKLYQKTRPNVSVNIVETAWNDLQQKLLTALTANQTENLPDIVLIQDNAIQKLVATYPKAFLPVDGKVDVSQFAKYKVDVATIGGKVYSTPFDNGATGTFLRRDIIENAGLKIDDFNDIDWDRFIELGKIVKQKTGAFMISAVGNENDLIPLMLQSAGSWFFDNNGKVTIKDNAALKEGMRVYKAMVDGGILLQVTDWNAYIASLSNAACTINGCWIVASISAMSELSGKWACANTPKLNVPGGVNYSNVGGSSWVVLANSKNAEIAFELLNKTFAGSVEFYETILPSAGAIATWLPASKSEVYEKPNVFFGGQKIYADIVDYSSKVPLVKYGMFNYEARDAVARASAEILKGAQIDTALEAAQKNVEFLMAGQ